MHTIRTGRIPAVVLTLILALCLFSQAALAEESLSLTTAYAGSDSNNNGNMFDVTVTSDQPLIIDSFDINLYQYTGTPTVNVYYRDGSYTDGSTFSDGWIFAGSAAVTPSPVDTPTALNVGNIRLESGQTYGFYITTAQSTDRLHYINNDTVYSDDNLTISPGAGKPLPEFTETTFEPRVWSGTIYYHICEPASGTSTSTRRHDAEHAFWGQVNVLIRAAEDSGVVQVDLTNITRMPRYVMRLLAQYPDVTLLLTYNGETVAIPGSLALAKDNRSAFTIEQLKELFKQAN